MSIDKVPATILRNNLSDVLDAMKQKDIMLIGRRGEVDVALVNIDLLEDLLELHDKDYLKSITDARKEAHTGKVSTFEEVFGEL
jgi:hypothetical protein